MSNARSTWQEQDKKDVESFFGHYGWKDIYSRWQRRIDDFATPTAPIFLELTLHDSGRLHPRDIELAWWPRAELEARHYECQQHFKDHPGTYGPTHELAYQGRKGELDTLRLLWKQRHNPEQVAAILISASLFSRVSGRSRRRPEGWPNANCLYALERFIRDQPGSEGIYWHHANSQVLPYENRDCDYRIPSLLGLVRFLAEEHAALLHQYAPVALHFA